ncbi:MAG: indolepyruvate oxidoreductase subunit beta family protein [Alphaproteobacteria bacterium]|nr:indolepyruvate oxidoreductase subunit beta family protein [Alphaproteobacteria bacterium]
MDASPPPPKAISIAILAMGGEGGGVLADWLIDMAERAGSHVQATSVPGVAQRTGATIYYVEIFPGIAVVAGKLPVLALMPMPGDVDVVIASELMEAGRAVQRGLVTPARTTLIASTHRVYSMTERTAMADGRVDSAKLIDGARAAAKHLLAADFAEIAEKSGSVISAALFGALFACGLLPFPRSDFEGAIRRSGLGVDASLRAFARAYDVASAGQETAAAANDQPPVPPPASLRAAIATFPSASRATIEAGCSRLVDFQDVAYAQAYLDRLEPFRTTGDVRLLTEVARHLALWMSYEDIARVADLKIRRSRFSRVAEEVRAGNDQILRIKEFLHPRLSEIADALPAGIGRWLLRSASAGAVVRRFTAKGRVVETTSIGGFLLLYAAAGLRRIRRRSLRFAVEQQRIEAWLGEIHGAAGRNDALALAIAECQQLVKGYGDTHARGLANYETVMATLPRLQGRPDAAERLSKLRQAALADDSGERLKAATLELVP